MATTVLKSIVSSVTSPGVLSSARTLLYPSECLIVFFTSCICLPHEAFETVSRSICESNVQKEKVAVAAASVESRHSLCLSASLWGRDYTLNPGMSRQKDEKDYFSLADTAENREWGGLSWQQPTGFKGRNMAVKTQRLFFLMGLNSEILWKNTICVYECRNNTHIFKHRLLLFITKEKGEILEHVFLKQCMTGQETCIQMINGTGCKLLTSLAWLSKLFRLEVKPKMRVRNRDRYQNFVLN